MGVRSVSTTGSSSAPIGSIVATGSGIITGINIPISGLVPSGLTAVTETQSPVVSFDPAVVTTAAQIVSLPASTPTVPFIGPVVTTTPPVPAIIGDAIDAFVGPVAASNNATAPALAATPAVTTPASAPVATTSLPTIESTIVPNTVDINVTAFLASTSLTATGTTTNNPFVAGNAGADNSVPLGTDVAIGNSALDLVTPHHRKRVA